MCGIAGIVSIKNIPLLENRLWKMVNSLKHRGPDIQQVAIINNNKAGFAHSRLKIIDLSDKANQPMWSHDRNFIISFNGEIYNYEEIRSKIESEGYKFKSNSDTEVILAATEVFGFKWFIKKANGMFAIALFDKRQKRLYLCRDRLGIKPLFYIVTNDTIIFSSEIKGILNSGLVDPVVNKPMIDAYLAFRYVPAPRSLFKNIFQVESGTIMEVGFNDAAIDVNTSRYWELPNLNNEYYSVDEKREKKVKLGLIDKLLRSVKYRMKSDVPYGAYLSGGVDSSLIAAIMALSSRHSLNTYTIGFKEKGFNEFYYARLVANKYKTNHHEILLNFDGYIIEWQKLISYKDAPLSVPNEVAIAIMSRELKKDITVVLSGEGADELFGGYGRIYRLPFIWANQKDKLEYVSKSERVSKYEFFLENYEYVPMNIRDLFLSSQEYTAGREEFRRDLFLKYFDKFSFQESIFRFFELVHLQGLLQRLDTSTMQTSVEGRVPFVDHKLIEFAYREIPLSLKLKWKSDSAMQKAKILSPFEFSEILDTPKYILKKLSLDYIPSEVVYRKKVGFPVPLNLWMSGESYRKVLQWFEEGIFVNSESIKKLVKSSKTSSRSGQILWMFINLEMWHKTYFKKSWRW